MSLPATDSLKQNTGLDQALTTYSVNWSVVVGTILVRTGNTFATGGTGGIENIARWNADVPNADQYIQCVLAGMGSGVDCGVAGRISASADTFYSVSADGGTIYVIKHVAGVETAIASPAVAFATGDVLRLEITGVGATVTLTTKKALAASPTVFSTVDTQTDLAGDRIIAAGYLGLFAYDSPSTVGLHTWEGGNLGGGAVASAGRDLRKFGPGVSPSRLQQFARRPLSQTFTNTDVTVALTGQVVTVSAGTLTPSVQYFGKSMQMGPGISPDYTKMFRAPQRAVSAQNVSVALTGSAVTVSAGTLVPSNAVPLAGQAAATTAGTLTPNLSLSLLGQAVTANTGTLLPTISITLNGIAVTASAGTLTQSGGSGSDVNVNLTGSAVTVSAGTLLPGLSIALVGDASVVVAGTLAPTTYVSPAGQVVTSSTGTLTPATSIALLGQSFPAVAGTLGTTGGTPVVNADGSLQRRRRRNGF